MFHIDWLLQLIPRSKKAAFIFVLMWLLLVILGSNVSALATPQPRTINIVLAIVAFVIGAPIAVYYYYLQARPKAGYSEVDTLDKYFISESRHKAAKAIITSSQSDIPSKNINK